MLKLVLKYALTLFMVLGVLKFLEFQFFSYKISLDVYLGVIAGVFLLAGLFISKIWHRINKPPILVESDNDRSGLLESEVDQQQLAQFSEREQQVLQLLCHGYTNKEIAKSLNISPNTVKTHLSKLFSKLDVSNRTQALSEAKSLKLII